ncbi:hypothetical protein [Frateuria sp. STR12]|uniref:hypothetical protein n=1 Tax=Frateuria hangzhouensis TaxID=2995589 RepID=UPI002260DDEC|nr:hypothetical protein [Frateuria sp. STR12]MCX7512381.1 hypothetical protein [Frateuria sp. STR12]
MKLRIRSILLVVGTAATGLTTASVRAQSVDPCNVYTCMAGISGAGTTGGPGCVPATTYFFSLVVFDPFFDAAATSQLRRTYLMTCPGANVATNAALLNAIIAEWGAVP